MAAIRYNDIIAAAITDFNSIQNALAGLSHDGHYVHDLDTASTSLTVVDNSDGSKIFATGNFGSIISGQLQIKSYDTLNINDDNVSLSTSTSAGTDATYARYVKVKAGSINTTAQSITDISGNGLLTGDSPSWVGNATSNGYVVSRTVGSRNINVPVTSGWISGDKTIPVNLGTVSVTIPNAVVSHTATDYNNLRVGLTSAGYLGNAITLDAATVGINGGGNINVTNSLTLKTDDNANVTGTNVYNDLFELGTTDTTKTTDATKYSNVTTTEAANTSYVAFTAGSTGGRKDLSLNVSKSGVANSQTTAGASVSTSGHADVTYYYPVKIASATLSAPSTRTTAAKPTATITSSNVQASVGNANSAYRVRLNLNAPATTGIAVNTSVKNGLLNSTSQITGTTATAASTSDYYINIPHGSVTYDGGAIKVTDGYVVAKDAPTISKANVDDFSISNLSATLVDTDDGKSGDSKDSTSQASINIFTTSVPTTASGDPIDYYKINANAHLKISAGYIAATDTSTSRSNLYVPKAVLEYVADSKDNDYVRVKTGGYLPEGSLLSVTDVGGTIDHAIANLNQTVNDSGITKNGSRYDVSATTNVTNYGYLDADNIPTGKISIPGGSVSGGGVTIGNYTGTSALTNKLTVSSSGTYISSDDTGINITVTGSKSQVTRAAVTTSSGYVKAGTAIAANSSNIIGFEPVTIYLKKASLNASARTAITSTTASPTASGGNAKIWQNGATGQPTTYVMVNATGSGSVTTTQGGIYDGSQAVTVAPSSGRLQAAINPRFTVSVSGASVGGATEFNATTGAISKTGQKSNSVTARGDMPNANTYKDCYIVGGFNPTASNSATVSINGDATGTNVDNAFQSLYERMLGQAYTEVTVTA